jgi:hypothetical protein
MTLADLFRTCYRNPGADVDFSAIRLHYTGADRACRDLRATAMTIGSDIYFRYGAFAPHTRDGLRLLAHEVAHVVQQCRGGVDAREAVPGLPIAPPGTAEEGEADAAASALIAGRPFCFAAAGSRATSGPQRVVQRYMAWEHCLLGDLGLANVEEHCTLLEDLGRDPYDVDQERLHAEHPGLETVRLPGSGLVVTLGELNILPDYLSHPAEIETAPSEFLEPLIQSVRSWSIAELRRSLGQPGPRHRLHGSLTYPRLRRLTEVCEAVEVDALGRRCGFAPWDLYSSVVGRNAAHFAPFSWYRWQSFHLMARELITRSRSAPEDARDSLVVRARIYAGYADHFLQDSYAAGHLINKTLVMQWYLEWLADSRIPYLDRRVLALMTASRQPLVHGPGRYNRAGAGVRPDAGLPDRPWDPQSTAEAPTVEERIEASGVVGDTEQERREAYAAYLAMLGSSVAQLAAGVVHGYFNKRSLIVAAGADGQRFCLPGDRTLLTGREGALRAAEAAAASRRALSEMLHRGGTDVTCGEILEGFPDHVEHAGALVGLAEWHDGGLRDLCFGQLFGLWRTRAMRVLLSVFSRRMGVPSADFRSL